MLIHLCTKTRRVDMIIEFKNIQIPKPRMGDMIK